MAKSGKAIEPKFTPSIIVFGLEERLALSRELHDEFGQNLTAISAMAASADQTAGEAFPALLPECNGIARIAAQMMDTLRGTLVGLRPPDIAELGLTASLQSLIADWNTRLRGKTSFTIEIVGSIDDMPVSFGTALYRIVQEAVTNAARHANADRVAVDVAASDSGQVELTIEDDGIGIDASSKSGMGLIGLRERVAALQGRATIETRKPTGTRLDVTIPLTSAMLASEARS